MAKRKVILELDDDLVEHAERFGAACGSLDRYFVEAITEKVAGDIRYEEIMANLRQRAIDEPIDEDLRLQAERQVEETLRRLEA